MAELAQALPGLRLSLSCDLTKLYECTLRGEPQALLEILEQNPNAEKGEYALVLDLSRVSPPAPTASSHGQGPAAGSAAGGLAPAGGHGPRFRHGGL